MTPRPRSGAPPQNERPVSEAASLRSDAEQNQGTVPYRREVLAGLRRRRAASRRCELLTSGVQDPWRNPASRRVGWTDREGAAWQAAAEHLALHGLYGAWQAPKGPRTLQWHRRAGGDEHGVAR
jgi:hypothetical protein